MRRSFNLLLVAALGMIGNAAHGQAKPTAWRHADLQIGGGYSFTAPADFSPERYKGPWIYAAYDFKSHWGAEANFHHVKSPSPAGQYERTYEIGGRYVRHYANDLINPYIRVSYGRAVVNFPYDIANLAYNMYAFGAGVDIRVHKHVNVRADFDNQHYLHFQGSSLSPNLVSIGAAYHF